MVLFQAKKLSQPFKISFAWAFLTALILFLGCFVLLTLVKVKRSNDLIHYSVSIANQLVSIPAIHQYLLEGPESAENQSVQRLIQNLIQSDPFIQELAVFNKPGKQFIHVNQAEKGLEPIPRASLSLHEVLTSNEPIYMEHSGETFVPLSLKDSPQWGVLRIRWRPKATWQFFGLLQRGMTFLTVGSFVLIFLLSYFVFQRWYTADCERMQATLKHICTGDYTQRIDTAPYSPGMKDLAAYINRILAEVQENRKKSLILNESLRQLEKGNSDYRKALGDRVSEIDGLRRELRQGLVLLFDLIWNGVLIVDDNYHIHYCNDQAEGMLRFARFDETCLVDERIKRCLVPLIRKRKVQRVDDLCVWPQRSHHHSVSCRVRAAAIPTADESRLFFVLLKEESGFPKHHDSSYFSERLVVDVLAHWEKDALVLDEDRQPYAPDAFEHRLRECLKKIELYKALEDGDYGPISSIRLPIWLQNHFVVDDLFSNNLNVETKNAEMEIALNVPERLLSQLMDALMVLVARGTSVKNGTSDKSSGHRVRVLVQPTVDSRGKPVIALTLPHTERKHALLLNDIFEEKSGLITPENRQNDYTLTDLEIDLNFSIYRTIRRLLKIQAECVYSESKRLITLRLTIENPAFTPPNPVAHTKEHVDEKPTANSSIPAFM